MGRHVHARAKQVQRARWSGKTHQDATESGSRIGVSDIVRVHDGLDPGRQGPFALGSREKKVFGDQKVGHGQAQFVLHGSSTRPEVFDGRPKDVISGCEEGLGVDVERLAAARSEVEALGRRTEAVNMQEQANKAEPQAEA